MFRGRGSVTPSNVGGDLHIIVPPLSVVHWSLFEVENFLGRLHSEPNLSLLPKKVHSSVSPNSPRRLVARYDIYIICNIMTSRSTDALLT